MNFLQRFKKKRLDEQAVVESMQPVATYVALPKYVECEPDQLLLLSLVTGTIGAGDNPTSRFVLKKAWQGNPELQRVAVLATAIAAQDAPTSRFIVKKIEKENQNVTKI